MPDRNDTYVRAQLPRLLSLLAESTALLQLTRHALEGDDSPCTPDDIDDLGSAAVLQMALIVVAQGGHPPPIPIRLLDLQFCDDPDCAGCGPVRRLIAHEQAEGRDAVPAERVYEIVRARFEAQQRRQAH